MKNEHATIIMTRPMELIAAYFCEALLMMLYPPERIRYYDAHIPISTIKISLMLYLILSKSVFVPVEEIGSKCRMLLLFP